jgi:hypothetical protein
MKVCGTLQDVSVEESFEDFEDFGLRFLKKGLSS